MGGMGESDSLFTIEANITLLSLKAQPGGSPLAALMGFHKKYWIKHREDYPYPI